MDETRYCPWCMKDVDMYVYETRIETWYTCNGCNRTPYIELKKPSAKL